MTTTLNESTGLPSAPRFVRRIARELGPQPTRPPIDDRRIVDQLIAGFHWRLGEAGDLVVQRRDRVGPGAAWTPWSSTEAARWAVEHRLGVPPGADVDDVDGVSPLRASEVSQRFALLVADQVRADLLRPAWPTKSPAIAFAQRMAATIELVVHRDQLCWRLAVQDPIRGGIGRPADAPAGPPLPAGAASLGQRIAAKIRPAPDLLPVDAATLDAHARRVGLLEPAAPVPAPGWPAVIDELQRLAGLTTN